MNRREPTSSTDRVKLFWQPTRVTTSKGAVSAEWSRVWYATERDPATLIHGSYSTYTNHRCRCPDCMEAGKVMNRAVRKRRAEREKASR